MDSKFSQSRADNPNIPIQKEPVQRNPTQKNISMRERNLTEPPSEKTAATSPKLALPGTGRGAMQPYSGVICAKASVITGDNAAPAW